ncbi:hypothetical protein OJ997_14935 [Solirubrobacter phytolaccae]|uniref:Uncharacterized protein n=1 Tax=Solirubrobacter phytolaccae TaxID=1404360 RepID=A0A9X3N889_9ACTN|nr:hypothetical protein [Solirubrobacter phytolaccae]MDA0181598.1 hypothetical protein [Solirubrobacter phytolaccae]
MPGRYALIAASAGDEDATALAGILGDPERGDFTVERTDEPDAIARFLAVRTPDDVVLVLTDGVPVDVSGCRSTHVLVLATDERTELDTRPGRALIAGAPTRAVVRALRDGRADGNADGEVTAGELHNRMSHTLQLQLHDGLETPFVVSRTRRKPRQAPADDRGSWDRDWRRGCVVAGVVALLGSLPLAWMFGATGLEYAFGEGTAWPSRIVPLACLAAALAGIVNLATRRGGTWIVLLASIGAGALWAFLNRFEAPDPGLGTLFAGAGLALLLVGAYDALRKWPETVGLACAGGAIVAYQLAGPRNWVWIVLGAAALAGGAFAFLRR